MFADYTKHYCFRFRLRWQCFFVLNRIIHVIGKIERVFFAVRSVFAVFLARVTLLAFTLCLTLI